MTLTDEFSEMSFEEYWRTYLPDLIEPLAEANRRAILDTLVNGFLDGSRPGRELVPRLIEVHLGVITTSSAPPGRSPSRAPREPSTF